MMASGNKKRRILFVLPALTAGGAERVLISLMNGLDRDLYEPFLAVTYNIATLQNIIDPSIPVFILHHKGHILLSTLKLLRLIRREKPEIIVSTMAPMNFTVLLLKPFLGRTKIIVREAITPSFLFQNHPVLKPIIRLMYRVLYPLADLILSPAKLIIQEFARDLKMSMRKHVWLPNPVDVDSIRQGQVIELRKEGLNFIAAGRLHSQKGFDGLITALRDFNPGQPWTVTILGEGPERKTLEDLIVANHLSDRVMLAGHVSAPGRYFGAADAFILCSRWEGLPNVVLESLACGTPVISLATAGGISEIAELAPQSVTVCNDLPDLLAAMKNVKPDPVQVMRPSLLPAIYQLQDVNGRFATLVDNIYVA